MNAFNIFAVTVDGDGFSECIGCDKIDTANAISVISVIVAVVSLVVFVLMFVSYRQHSKANNKVKKFWMIPLGIFIIAVVALICAIVVSQNTQIHYAVG